MNANSWETVIELMRKYLQCSLFQLNARNPNARVQDFHSMKVLMRIPRLNVEITAFIWILIVSPRSVFSTCIATHMNQLLSNRAYEQTEDYANFIAPHAICF